MMRHAKTVAEIYAAFRRGDIAGILGALREDVEWEHDAVDHGIPWLTPRQGRAQVAAFFEALRALDFRRFEPQRILADDTMAAAVIHVGSPCAPPAASSAMSSCICGPSTRKARSRASATSPTPTSIGWRCAASMSSCTLRPSRSAAEPRPGCSWRARCRAGWRRRTRPAGSRSHRAGRAGSRAAPPLPAPACRRRR